MTSVDQDQKLFAELSAEESQQVNGGSYYCYTPKYYCYTPKYYCYKKC